MKFSKRGFTLMKVFQGLFLFACLALLGGAIWVGIHFIAKYW